MALTQHRPHGALAGRRFGSFAGKTADTGPTIDTQPTNQTAKVGATATYTIAATTSGGTLHYQWKFNGTNVGTDSSSYARTGVVLGDHGGTVTCVVTDDNGDTTSSGATLTVAVTFAGTVPAQTGTVGGSFSLDLSSYFSGGLSRTYAVQSGTLPGGVSQTGTTAVFAGTLTTAASGSFVVRATDSATNTDDTGTISWTISAAGVGTLTSSPLKANTGVLHLSAPFEAYVNHPSTGALVVKKTSLTSHASTGVITFSDAALSTATEYAVRWRRTDTGAEGYERLTTT